MQMHTKWILALALGAAPLSALSQAPPSAQDLAKAVGPIVAGAHFHHVHLNVKDRAAELAFYPRHFKARVARFADTEDAIWTQRSWILFNLVGTDPEPQAGTAISHFGFGAPDAKAEFARQQKLGATFMTELTDISRGLGGEPEQFQFMYVRGPGGEQIEINTDPDSNFGHVHLSSADPLATGAWYRNMFGFTEAPPYFPHLVVQTGSGRTSRQFFDNVNFIVAAARPDATFRSSANSIVDHIAVSVPNLDAALAAVRTRRVPVVRDAASGPKNAFRHAFIEGPDKILIELIEDKSTSPPLE